jgi:hypothetical protein
MASIRNAALGIGHTPLPTMNDLLRLSLDSAWIYIRLEHVTSMRSPAPIKMKCGAFHTGKIDVPHDLTGRVMQSALKLGQIGL